MRIRLKGNADRALDLVRLDASYIPTGGDASARGTKQDNLWNGSPENIAAGGNKDST